MVVTLNSSYSEIWLLFMVVPISDRQGQWCLSFVVRGDSGNNLLYLKAIVVTLNGSYSYLR